MTTDDQSPQAQFYALLDRYNQGIEPLENWESLDLAKLETLVNAELQERQRNATGCACVACQPHLIREDSFNV